MPSFKISIKLFVFAITIILNCNAFAQSENLIYNGSFELYSKCPDNFGINARDQFVYGWTTPSNGTPDYFHRCSDKSGVPINWVGHSEPFEGDAYMGIIACMQQIDKNQIAYREYMSTKLLEPMDSGKTYYVSFNIKLGLSCNTACNGIGAFFTKNKLQMPRTHNIPVEPEVILSGDPILNDKKEWMKICGTYKATGDEEFMIIGNFWSNQQMDYVLLNENLIETPKISNLAYYYVDVIELYEANDSLLSSCNNCKEIEITAFKGNLPPNSTLVLENLYFDIDKSVILPQSYDELNKLVRAMKQHRNVKISIDGHTDNTGTTEHNMELSNARAVAVRNYLITKGISRLMIQTKGYGDTKPIADNETEEGRKINRRVEIKVLN